MGLFDFLRRDNSQSYSEIEIKQRWAYQTNGSIKDRNSSTLDSYAALISTNSFENWFFGLEQRIGQSLGRRLAHAALEHEEYMLKNSRLKPPSGSEITNWSKYNLGWHTRGLGEFRKLYDEDEIKLIIEKPASTSVCSGIIASAWEIATKKRYRFVWSQNTRDELIVSLQLDEKEIPSPSMIEPSWPFSTLESVDLEIAERIWEDLRIESNGYWSILNERHMILHRDLFLRFEEYCLPYITKLESGRENFVWPIEDEKRILWWTALADSVRKSTYDRGLHILVSKPEDWIAIGRRHLAMNGLGRVESVKKIDPHGGVEIYLSSIFHPAVSGGILLACWERAYGRQGKIEFSFNSGAVSVILSSSVEIAN